MRITSKIVSFLFSSLLIIRPTPVLAWEHEHWHRHSYVDVSFGVWPNSYYYGYPYYYPYDYPYYPYYSSPYYYPAYAVVSSSSYQPVVVNGVTYYVNNGVYYIYTQYGYQAVVTPVTGPVLQAAPPAVTLASVDMENSFTVNVPNNKGGYTAVVIKKSGNGYVGPQGEFYSEFPKVSQLQQMYGK